MRALALFAFAAVTVAFSAPHADAQQAPVTVEARTAPISSVTPGQYNGDVRDLPAITFTTPRYYHMWNEFEEPMRLKPATQGTNGPSTPPLVEQLAPMPAPSANFAGIGFSDSISGDQAGAGWPPDTNGDVGPTVYIQAVNDAFGIYNKTGTQLAAFTEDQLWSVSGLPSNNPCFNNNEGDPVVLHDTQADRWVLTNFGFAFDGSGNPVAPFYQCIAVSQTSDPVAGGWYFYAVQMDTGVNGAPPANTFNDYGKFGIWTDCLYMGANGFDNSAGSYAGAIFAAFSRNAIYAGQTLDGTNSSIGFLSGSSAPFAMFPANLLGTSAASQPPTGTPEYFVDASQGTGWEVRKFVAGTTACGAGSSLSTATVVSQTFYGYPVINPANYTTDMVGQKSTANKLDSLGDRIMQKVQYRKVGAAESLWVVHTTCGPTSDTNGACATSTTTTQPQWAQIKVTGGTIATAPVQQQIFAPDTTYYRWMGSLAVDNQGNMALGYSKSRPGSTATALNPSIFYAGRKVTDTLGQLPQTEVALATGGGSQTRKIGTPLAFISRWGDYSAMSVDPADDCTCWYTNEYYVNQTQGTAGNWQTRIGSFKFPGCVAVTTYTIGGNVSGLTGTNTVGLTLTDTTTSATQVLGTQANGSFTFPTGLNPGDGWSVAVTTQPTGQTCAVTNGSGTNLSANVTNVTVTCTTNTFTLTYTTDGNGTITSGNATQTGVPYGGNGTAVTVVPSAGYHFVQWSDAATANPRTDTNVQANISVQANFAANVLVYTTPPADVMQGNAPGTIAVTEQDGSSNTVPDTATVDFTITTACGTFDLGSVTMVNGVATLTSAQRFYTLVSGLSINAAITNPNPTPIASIPSGTFSVTTNTDFVFSDGFDGCRL